MSQEIRQQKNDQDAYAFEGLETLYGVPSGYDAIEVLHRVKAAPERPVLYVALDDNAAVMMQGNLRFFGEGVDVLYLPAWDCLPYDRVSPSQDVLGHRAKTLTRLAQMSSQLSRPCIVIVTVNGLLQKLPPVDTFKRAGLSLVKDSVQPIKDVISFLSEHGFYRVDTVREPREFAVRGDILDLFPADARAPYRVDFFGDDIEMIRHFDPITQRTMQGENQKTLEVSLGATSELILTEQAIKNFRAGYRSLFGMPKDSDTLYESIKAGQTYAGMEHWLPLFFEDPLITVFDYLPNASLIFGAHTDISCLERFKQTDDFYQSRVMMQKQKKLDISQAYLPVPMEKMYLGLSDLIQKIEHQTSYILNSFRAPSDDKQDCGAMAGRDFADIRVQKNADIYTAVTAHIHDMQEQKKRVIVSAYSDGARDRLKMVLQEHGVRQAETVGSWKSAQGMKPKSVGFITLGIEHGFETDDLAIISEQDILGDRLSRPRARKKKKSSDTFLSELSQISEGDYIVHQDHGVGKFEKLETLDIRGIAHDCLKLLYKDGDRLFVPVENIDVLTRYGSADIEAQLDRMGSASWQSRKAKVKKDLLIMAEGLMKIAAARLLKTTETLDVPEIDYQKFCAGFPYLETEDQQNAIDDVIQDFKVGQAMDRLVCGDVGFGKTEVALRAAFVAAMAGYQVAIVAPTTLLARQHYQEFLKRFKGFPVRIVALSRLVKPADAKRAREEISSGDANIVVGTHALLGKSVKFNNLGLVVVDEEQRFGVKQKERLKELQDNVHVLTLTATPIPRTLQMSLTGVKDLSLITTPPVDRLAVRTFIMPRDPVILREALMREHFRGGQSFYVCPRVADLAEVEIFLKMLVPDLKVITAHGQMDSEDLEDRVTAFIDGKYDILLATNIIESGIDIPNSNTMIIHRADMFGLAQLYQLRGRIGRSKARGYAYMTYAPEKRLTKTAEQRLKVLEQLNTLGAGFQLASHDMDIRGAGNLLGEEQSGHIREVGVELYHQMLEEAVAAIREGREVISGDTAVAEQAESFTPQIELGAAVLIPESYVKDINVRLQLYRQLSSLVEEQEIEAFAADMIDRFGDLPDEVQNLLDITSIKQLAKQAYISKIDAGPKGAVLKFHEDTCPYVEKLVAYMAENAGTIKMRPDQKLVFTRVWPETRHRVKGVRMILRTLVGLKIKNGI